MMMAHEAELIIPGSFVVLQGNAGDGMSNTIDTVPIEDDDDDVEQYEMDYHSQPSPHRGGDIEEVDLDENVNENDDVDYDEGEFHHVENVMCIEEAEEASPPRGTQQSQMVRQNQASSSNKMATATTTSSNTATPRVVGLGQLATGHPKAIPTLAFNRWTHTNNNIIASSSAAPVKEERFLVVTDTKHPKSSPASPPPGRTSTGSERYRQPSRHQHAQAPPAAQSQQSRSLLSSALQSPTTSTTQQEHSIIEQWQKDCREQELRQRLEWKEANSEQQLPHQQLQEQKAPPFSIATMRNILALDENSNHNKNTGKNTTDRNNSPRDATDEDGHRDDEEEWWQRNGQVAIFQEIPTTTLLRSSTTSRTRRVVNRNVIGTLGPGSTVVATDLVYLDSHTLERVHVAPITSTHGNVHTAHQIFPRGRQGWIQLLKLEYHSQPTTPQHHLRSHLLSTKMSATTSSSYSAYAVLSLDGYPLLTPGLPSLYVEPNVWIWRVTCPAGAYVREGLDLYSRHIDTIPYGSLVRVTRKTVNAMGLSRIRVQSIVDDVTIMTPVAAGATNTDAEGLEASAAPATAMVSSVTFSKQQSHQQPHHPQQQPQQSHLFPYAQSRVVDGWCSEFLNPLSGQRGVVAQPVPFPVPALYRITLKVGAVIRKTVELSSAQIGIAPMGAIVTVVARAFSEHPMDKCIERLQLAGNGGWISVRLNCPPPGDNMVVELVGIDGTFEPDAPGKFHLQACRTVRQEHSEEDADIEPSSNPSIGAGAARPGESRRGSAGCNPGDISSIDDSHSHSTSSGHSSGGGGAPAASPAPTVRRTASAVSRGSRGGSGGPIPPGQTGEHSKCLICLTEERNATIVHGETGHVACCLVCARILKARGDKCPVCRLNIDLVIQQFWA